MRILTTDLEPDDLIAMIVLQRNGFVPNVIIAGEGVNPEMKVQRASKIASILWPEDVVRILPGTASDKEFGREGQAEGLSEVPVSTDTRETAAVLATLNDGREHEIIALKPMRDIFAAWLADGNTFKTTKLYVYGSFNFRCVLKGQVEEFTDMINTGFANVRLYETYLATGDENTINDANSPEFWTEWKKRADEDEKGIFALTQRLITDWNEFMLDDCLETVKEYTEIPIETITEEQIEREAKQNVENLLAVAFIHGPIDREAMYDEAIGRIRRNVKRFRQVAPHKDSQFVAADIGVALFAYLDKAVPAGTLKRGHYKCHPTRLYTTMEDSDDGKVEYFHNIGFDTMRYNLHRALFL